MSEIEVLQGAAAQKSLRNRLRENSGLEAVLGRFLEIEVSAVSMEKPPATSHHSNFYFRDASDRHAPLCLGLVSEESGPRFFLHWGASTEPSSHHLEILYYQRVDDTAPRTGLSLEIEHALVYPVTRREVFSRGELCQIRQSWGPQAEPQVKRLLPYWRAFLRRKTTVDWAYSPWLSPL